MAENPEENKPATIDDQPESQPPANADPLAATDAEKEAAKEAEKQAQPNDPLLDAAQRPASERSSEDIAREVRERREQGQDAPPLVPELTESGDEGSRVMPSTEGAPVEAPAEGEVAPPSDAERVQLGDVREHSAAPDADNPEQKQNQLPGPQTAGKPPIPETRHIPTSEDRKRDQLEGEPAA